MSGWQSQTPASWSSLLFPLWLYCCICLLMTTHITTSIIPSALCWHLHRCIYTLRLGVLFAQAPTHRSFPRDGCLASTSSECGQAGRFNVAALVFVSAKQTLPRWETHHHQASSSSCAPLSCLKIGGQGRGGGHERLKAQGGAWGLVRRHKHRGLLGRQQGMCRHMRKAG